MNNKSPNLSRLSPSLSRHPSQGAQLAQFIEDNTQDKNSFRIQHHNIEKYQSMGCAQQWSNQQIIMNNEEDNYQGDETPLQGSVIKKNSKNQQTMHQKNLNNNRVVNAIQTPQGISELVLNDGGVYGVETERYYMSHGKNSSKNSEKPKLYATLKQAKGPRPNFPSSMSSQQPQSASRQFKIQSSAKAKSGIKLNEGYKQALKILNQIQNNERLIQSNLNSNNLKVGQMESQQNAMHLPTDAPQFQKQGNKKSLKSLQSFKADNINQAINNQGI